MEQEGTSGRINKDTYLIDINMLGVPRQTSVYVVEAGKKALIDGGTSTEARGIIKSLKSFDLLSLDYIIVTHAHFDHHQGIPALLKEMPSKDVQILAHPKAIPLLEDPQKVGYDFGIGRILPIKGARPVKEGDTIDLEGLKLQVIDTPGHTSDGISLLDNKNKNIFVGDAVIDKFDKTTSAPEFLGSSFDFNKYTSTLNKLRGLAWKNICLGHYGMWHGSDVKNILEEGKTLWEGIWRFFDNNNEHLDNLEWMTKNVADKFMPDSETFKKTGMLMLGWMIGSYKKYKKL